ncbi:DNA-binding NarL/FixJ family response regulator [Arcicella aurantiaca]|uniref:DNA-binding NarL/FixJ family response regulator n=1 Tax=Arcicella aurantiaca TaxID=591202 RepID=A0A316DJG0_9BACT|nr:response regulator transcription factor [Arcicella aurantiaca]PWK18065.1 DNA-binding NarL/FixJ family response regulator [Arcicella aurantiaca]
MNMITIAIADDQMLFRKGMAAIINGFENMAVTCEADNGRKLLGFLETATQRPDAILMDLSMPDLNGIDTMKIIHEQYPDQKVIILSIHNEEKFVVHLIELGASAYLFKNSEPEDVEKAIRGVIEKGFYFSEDTLNTFHKRLSNKKTHVSVHDNIPIILSTREVEVLNLICQELTAQEIAEKLFISVRTVDGHRNNLLEKTGARNTAGLVIFAIKNNLVNPTVLL